LAHLTFNSSEKGSGGRPNWTWTFFSSALNPHLVRIYMLTFLFSLSVSMNFLTVPLFAYSLGASQLEIGLIGFVYTGMQIPLSIFFGRLSDRVGRMKLLLASLIFSSSSMMLLALNSDLLPLFLIRPLGGIASAIFWPVSGALIADNARRGDMVKVMGLVNVCWGLSSMIGPVMVGFLMDYFKDIRIAFLFGTLISLATFPIAAMLRRSLSVQREGLKQEKGALGSKDVPSKSIDRTILAWSFLAIMLFGFLLGIVDNLFPVYSVMLGFSKTMTGMFQTISSVASVMAFWSVGYVSARFGKLNSTLIGTLACAAIAIVAVYSDLASIAFAMALIGLGTGIIHPTARAAVLELSSSRRGYYIGILESLSTGGMSIGAVVGGALATYVNRESPYYFSSLMAITVFLVLLILSRRKDDLLSRRDQ